MMGSWKAELERKKDNEIEDKELEKFFMKRILITGAESYIGTSFEKWLKSRSLWGFIKWTP